MIDSVRQIESDSRLDRGDAEVIIYSKGGLKERLPDVNINKSPKDFYYGFLGLLEQECDLRMFSISDEYPGFNGKVRRFNEKIWARISGISDRHNVLTLDRKYWCNSKKLISFTDHFSLTLGAYFRKVNNAPYTIGLFHGLCHFENRLTFFGKVLSDAHIKKALEGLDYVGFFGPEDRRLAISRYNLNKNKTGVFRFGVDTGFWRNNHAHEKIDNKDVFDILSVGSDPSRDYDTLVKADIADHINIITRLPVNIPIEKQNIYLNTGDFYKSSLSDVDLREMYNKADVVVIPLHDVLQPSGYSVTLQAMACEKPVILSDIKGLWTPELLIDEENCLLVKPGDPTSIANAINKLKSDSKLRKYIAKNGRKLVENHFTLKDMEESLTKLLER